jgi:Serine dehydrogenase proteinase
MELFDETVKTAVTSHLLALEKHFEADVAFYYGSIQAGYLRPFRDFIEKTSSESCCGRTRLAFFLNTSGGSAEAVEKMVEILRHHFREIYFVIPDFALSAGTILAMSGDRIYMDYSSSLGPIDPQVWNGKDWVPALGYLDKVDQLLDKAAKGTLTNAEFLVLQNQDLALLSRYEQARDLTVTLLKKWLVEYKFRDWAEHGSDPQKKGQPVTQEEKQLRAEEIAKALGNNKLWHSHGRMIGPSTLKAALRLRINDYSADETVRPLIRVYNDFFTQHIARGDFKIFLHSRSHF